MSLNCLHSSYSFPLVPAITIFIVSYPILFPLILVVIMLNYLMVYLDCQLAAVTDIS